MLIARNTVVTLNYSVRDTEGASIDEGTNPLVYLHGQIRVLPEEAHEVGEFGTHDLAAQTPTAPEVGIEMQRQPMAAQQ